jgi:5-methylcytosine-specific restriction protein A
MNAYMMTWSTAGGWPHEELKKIVEKLSVNRDIDWRISAYKKAEIGDRVYFYKQGKGPKGVFGVGNIVSKPFASTMVGSVEPMMRTKVRVEKMVDPLEQMLIPADQVKYLLPVNAQASGITIANDSIPLLEELLLREPVSAASKNLPWSEQEIEAAVDAYLEMLDYQIRGQPYSKTKVRNQTLSTTLKNRSSASFEFRMRNITAVMEELGLTPLKGYIYAPNVGRYRAYIKELLRVRLGLNDEIVPTADKEQLDQQVRYLRKSGPIKRPEGNQTPRKVEQADREAFVRDPWVKAWVLQQAAGKCERCDSPAPFLTKDGQPFLEVHHVVPLTQYGPDKVENAVAICPNCHRECHFGADIMKAREHLYNKISRLLRYENLSIVPTNNKS